MPKIKSENGDRTRQLLAQEAARFIVDHGIRDYRVAKTKAAERLGFNSRGSLPANAEIERAVSEHLQLFRGESHTHLLLMLRRAALSAMDMLRPFSPRLVGPVLQGTADDHSAINLHVFADSPEVVAITLSDLGLNYRPYERRLKSRRNQVETYAGFEFKFEHAVVQSTVFPVDGIRQAPISPINGKPMQRADVDAVRELIAD